LRNYLPIAKQSIDEENHLMYEGDRKFIQPDHFSDWPEKYFSGQSEGRNLTISGTRLVRKRPRGSSALEVNFRTKNIVRPKISYCPD